MYGIHAEDIKNPCAERFSLSENTGLAGDGNLTFQDAFGDERIIRGSSVGVIIISTFVAIQRGKTIVRILANAAVNAPPIRVFMPEAGTIIQCGNNQIVGRIAAPSLSPVAKGAANDISEFILVF